MDVVIFHTWALLQEKTVSHQSAVVFASRLPKVAVCIKACIVLKDDISSFFSIDGAPIHIFYFLMLENHVTFCTSIEFNTTKKFVIIVIKML